VALSLMVYFAAHAQTVRRAPLIARAVDENQLVTLSGNTRSEAIAQNDRGRVPDDLPLRHLLLQLKRSPGQQAELRQLLDEQQDPHSPNYQHWLTAAQFGERFGTTAQDVDILTQWLGSHGFTVNQIHPGRMLIDFSGTAGQVRGAFHTEIHALEVQGTRHIANMSDPRIPAALAPAIQGVVSLHDFRPHPLNKPRGNYTFTSNGATWQVLVPDDLATIYNFNPAFATGYTGLGQTIVTLEDTNVYSPADFTVFRSTFGLTQRYPSGNLIQVQPTGGPGGTCGNAGINADDAEAEIDVEWASAAAPNATIELAACADTDTNFGGFIALQNLLAEPNPPTIVSISYGEAESQLGNATNAYILGLYQMAAAEGVSIFVSAGDEGAASSDAGETAATHGITISGFASTPYNVAVGGTDFGDTYAQSNSTYWNVKNGAYSGSAVSYIPEIPWNDSCASGLVANFLGFSTTYGSAGLCNNSLATQYGLLTVTAGSGGPSNCGNGNSAPTGSGYADGTCFGYTKPSWQAGIFGNPADGVRDIPDVSMFASNGLWGHYYLVCYSDPGRGRGGEPCSGNLGSWAGFGGTSVAAPIMAGIQALINQRLGAPQGNPNPNLYSLAKSEYGTSGNIACNSSLGNAISGNCIFNDITLGDMAVNCTGPHNCYPSPQGVAANGVLSASESSDVPAYGAGHGWDFATGIGSVNAYLLVKNWGGTAPPFPSPLTITTKSLNSGQVNTAYSQTLGATGGTVPYSWQLTSGMFPNGLMLNASTGLISGTPTATVANVSLGFTVTDKSTPPVTATATFTLTIAAQATPASITATSGTPQTAGIGTAFGLPLVATVKDSGGNPVTGAIVAFAAPTSGASGSFAGGMTTASTNGSGTATSAIFTANGIAGSYTVTASVTGVATPASFSLTNTAGGILLPANATVNVGESAPFAVTLGAPAPAGGVFITLASSNPSNVTVTPNVSIPAGATAPTSQPKLNGIAFGSATISASAPGFSTVSQGVQSTDTLTFSPSSLTIIGTARQQLFLTLSAPAPTTLVINVSSSNPAVASVPQTVTIQANASSINVPVTGVGGGPAVIHASAVSYIADTTANVTVIGGFGITTASLAGGQVGTPYSQPLSVNGGTSPYTWSVVSGTLPNGLKLNASTGLISGTPTATATNLPLTFSVSDSSSPPLTATASLALNIAPAATAGGIVLPATEIVPVGGSAAFPISLGAPAPPGGIFVTLQSSDQTTVSVTGAVLIASGATTPVGTPKVNGIAFGSATITASAPGFTTVGTVVQSTDTVAFSPGNITVSGSTPPLLFLILSAPAPPGGLTLQLSSSNTNVATVPATVTIPANSSNVSVRVIGVAPGTATITAGSAQVANATATVTVSNE
jgi:hypothetical protein